MKYTNYSIKLSDNFIDLNTIEVVNIKGMNFSDDNGNIYAIDKRKLALRANINGELRYLSEQGNKPYIPCGGKEAFKMLLETNDFVTNKNNFWVVNIDKKDIDNFRNNNKKYGYLTLDKLNKFLNK